MNRARTARLLNLQLAMNVETLRALRKYGVSASKKKRLDFQFVAKRAADARALARALREYDGYEARWTKDGRDFVVYGASKPIAMAKRPLDEFVGHMCIIGAHHDAEFDGWGTSG